MKKLLFILALVLPAMGIAKITYQGKTYLACESCTTDQDFIDAAISDYEKGAHSSTYVIVKQSFNSTGVTFQAMKTVKLSPRMRLNRWGEPEFTYVGVIVNNDLGDEALYSEFDAEMTYAASHNNMSTFHVGSINIIQQSDMFWIGSGEFGTQYRTQINDIVDSLDINPFFFSHRSLTIRIKTADNYFVYLTGSSHSNNRYWTTLFATYELTRALYDRQGNWLDVPTWITPTQNDSCVAEPVAVFCDGPFKVLNGQQEETEIKHIEHRANSCRPTEINCDNRPND